MPSQAAATSLKPVACRTNKYAAKGAYHWDEFKRRTDYRKHAKHIAETVQEQRILDVGAGDGLITHLLREKGKDCVGIDSDPLAVSFAKERNQPVELCDIYDAVGQFDAIYLGDVLEHLDHPRLALKRLAQLAPALYLATPPRGRSLGKCHVQEWTQNELRLLAAQCGWQETKSEIVNKRIVSRYRRANITVAYTAIFGGKDSLKIPKVIDDTVSYICFTDNHKLKRPPWNIWRCDALDADPCRAAKIYKVVPNRFLSCDRSLWVDGSMKLVEDVAKTFTLFDELLAFYSHLRRHCVYKEAIRCKQLGKDDPQAIDKTVQWLRSINYPRNAGLLAAYVIFRRHCDTVTAFNELWWATICEQSRRDQLTLMPCLRHSKIPYRVFRGRSRSLLVKKFRHRR